MILLFSGGRDSTLLAIQHIKQIKILLHFQYDHPAKILERIAVERIYLELKQQNNEIELITLNIPIDAKTMFIGVGEKGPRYVPARNAIMLSIASNIALCRGIKSIIYGANKSDYSDYEDCRAPFMEKLSALLHVQISAPLLYTTKQAINNQLKLLNPDLYFLTWSCYQPDQTYIPARKCGTCNACKTNLSHE